MKCISRSSCLSAPCCAAIVTASMALLTGTSSAAQDQRVSPGQHASKEFTVKLEAKPHKQYCKARAVIEYSQKNTIARIGGEITKEGCMVATGDYTVSIRFRDENGETHDLEFEEQWASDSELPVSFGSDYEIGQNVDLVRARTKRLRCLCVETEDAGDGQRQDKITQQE